MSKLVAVHIDDPTWDAAERRRRDEWRLAITELVADPEQSFAKGAHQLRVTVSSQSTFFELTNHDGGVEGHVDVPWTALTDHVTEYVDIVRQMDRAGEGRGSARLEALDIAKKLAHDSAARALCRHLGAFGPNHAAGRRLWTLLLSLRVDTTRLTGVRGHRPVRS